MSNQSINAESIVTFDLIFLHSVTQYFPSDAYFKDFLEHSLSLLNPGVSLILVDVPITWYKEFMTSNRRSNLARFLKPLVNFFLPQPLINKIKNKRRITQKFGDIEIEVPMFRGYWVDPLVIEEFAISFFQNYEMSYQLFQSKPLSYKCFRPIFALKGKV